MEEYRSHTNSIFGISSKKTSTLIEYQTEKGDFKYINTISEKETSFSNEVSPSSVGTVQKELSPTLPNIVSPVEENISSTIREESTIPEKIDAESGGDPNLVETEMPVFESLDQRTEKEGSCIEEHESVESGMKGVEERPDVDPDVEATAKGVDPDQAIDKNVDNNLTTEITSKEETDIHVEMEDSSLNKTKICEEGKLEIVLNNPISKLSVQSTLSSLTKKMFKTVSSEKSLANSSLFEYHQKGGHLWTRQKMSSSERCSSAGDLHSSCQSGVKHIEVMPSEQKRPASSYS